MFLFFASFASFSNFAKSICDINIGKVMDLFDYAIDMEKHIYFLDYAKLMDFTNVINLIVFKILMDFVSLTDQLFSSLDYLGQFG